MKVMKLRITHPFADSGSNMPDFYRRIDNNILEGKPTIILIDGKTQSGKSTLARSICMRYNQDYKRFFTVKDFISFLNEIKNKCELTYDTTGKLIFAKIPNEYLFKWILFDEVELEAPIEDLWKNRNKVLTSITSGFGFLKENLIMTLPDITGVSKRIYKNITFRITTRSYLNNFKKITRKAYIKIPIYDDNKNKYFWVTVQEHTIPFIAEDHIYNAEKTHNFFFQQLPTWDKELNKPKEDYLNPNFYRRE
jgi:archaellum biogenesis ATPase FlaH